MNGRACLRWPAGPALMVTVLAAIASCDGRPEVLGPEGEDPTVPPSAPPVVVVAIVSDPAPPLASAVASGTAALTGPVTYVSLVPGTFPSGRTAAITNQRTRLSVVAGVLDGGVDPVAIEALSGDTLGFTIDTGAAPGVRFSQIVPGAAAIRVVRTDPGRGTRDVPLNLRLRVVFSEPVDPSSVTPASLGLELGGLPVPGQLGTSADGLEATFQPSEDLAPGTEYALEVRSEIRDTDGDALAAPETARFTTAASDEEPPGAAPGVLAVSVSGGIHVMNLDGSGDRALTPDHMHGAFDHNPAWSPDGNRIAFARHDGWWGAQIHVINADGSHSVSISPAGAYDDAPTWSPDGSRIAFENRADNMSGGHIFVMNADGTNRVRLTTNLQPNFQPAWSPDGSRIAYATYSDEDGTLGIYLIRPDGSERVRLTPRSVEGLSPVWSPDGERVAFSRAGELYVIRADGTGLTRLTSGLGGVDYPTWSPDGQMIAFTVYSGCDPWMVPCTGDEVVLPPLWVFRLSDGNASPLPEGDMPGFNPSWRP